MFLAVVMATEKLVQRCTQRELFFSLKMADICGFAGLPQGDLNEPESRLGCGWLAAVIIPKF